VSISHLRKRELFLPKPARKPNAIRVRVAAHHAASPPVDVRVPHPTPSAVKVVLQPHEAAFPNRPIAPRNDAAARLAAKRPEERHAPESVPSIIALRVALRVGGRSNELALETKAMAEKQKSTVAKSVARKARKSKSPLKGLHSRDVKDGALPPNKDQRKHPDETYGDTEIPFRR
jgi:hypothetical protein